MTPASSPPSAGSTPSAASIFARRVRALRVALAIALVIVVPLLVGMASQRAAEAPRADATAVARTATRTPGDLDRLRRAHPDVRSIAIYRRSGGRYREVASSGTPRGEVLHVDVPARGGRVVRVGTALEASAGFPVGLTLAVALAALIGFGLIDRFGVRRLARVAGDLAEGHQSLEALALEDPLTGLPNKRAFNDRLEAELGRAAREYYPVSIVAMDLDKFKQINDTWGHGVGDEALKKLSKELQRQLRAGDLCGRLGGDEFMLALVRADAATAERVLQRIKDALAGVEVGPGRQKLRFSAGIAEFPRHSTEMDTVIHQADAALYWGKANGRDRWHVYSAEASRALGEPAGADDGVRRRSMLGTLQQLAKAVDGKNRFMADHSERVSAYAVELARSLNVHEERVERIRVAALLHDVGKIGVPTPVLIKEGPLNLEDLDQLARHSELGHAMIAGGGMPEEARVVFHVHERWDGGGFPDKLAGEEIPLESRIICAADALDRATRPTALRNSRPLREALAELEFSAGTKLDPDVCARLVSMVRGGEIKLPGYEFGPRSLGDRRAAAVG